MVTYYASNSDLAADEIIAIAVDASGDKWFGTPFDGVSRFDGTSWITYNTSNSGLASGWVRTIAIDASGNKWFGMTNISIGPGGVSMFHE